MFVFFVKIFSNKNSRELQKLCSDNFNQELNSKTNINLDFNNLKPISKI